MAEALHIASLLLHAHREPTEHEWARLKANNSLECCNRHKGIAHRLPDISGVPGW